MQHSFSFLPLHRGSLHALPLNNPISRDRVQRCDAGALMTLVIDASRVGCDASIRETHRRACYFPRFHRVRANYRLPSAGLNKTSHRFRNDRAPNYFLSTFTPAGIGFLEKYPSIESSAEIFSIYIYIINLLIRLEKKLERENGEIYRIIRVCGEIRVIK